MSHRCPECGCTVCGGDFIDRPCWTCEETYYGRASGWRNVGFLLAFGLGLLYLAFGGSL